MKRHSILFALGLALLVAVVAVPSSSPSQTSGKVTVLNNTGPASDEPGQRWYYESLSGNESKILSLRRELIAAGARYVSTFLPGLVVCEIPLSMDAYAIARDPDIRIAGEDQVDHRRASAPIFSSEWVKRCYLKYDEYAAALSKKPRHAPDHTTMIDQDGAPESSVRRIPEEVIQRNARRVAAKGEAAQDERLIFQNSEIMSGDILLQVVFPESSGPDENWANSEIDAVMSGVVVSTTYYEREFRGGDAKFIRRWLKKIPTSTEPINFTMQQDSLWVTDVMGQLGFPGYQSEYLELVHEFNSHYRENIGADWAFTAFVVRAVNDPDHMFQDARNVSYAYLGGPFMTVPYPAGSPGTFIFSQAFKLQMSRIFWAVEEALGGLPTCETTSGYLDYLNSNKVTGVDKITGMLKSCLGNPDPCVANKTDMMENEYAGAPCRYTEGMMGGSDYNPVDGVVDVFGIPPEIAFGTTAIETLTSQTTSVHLSTTAIAVQNRNSQQPPELRRNYAAPIKDANYWFNGIGPISLSPVDGEFDELEEEFLIEIPILMPGYSTLEVSVRNAFGAQSNAGKQIFYLGLDYYGFRFNHGNDGVGLAWSMRGATFDANFDLHRIDHDNGDDDNVIVTGLEPVGSVSEGGMTPFYYYDRTVSPGSNYSYYVDGSFQAIFRGELTYFYTASDTFNTIAAFQRNEGILSSPSPNPFRPSMDEKMWVSVSVPNAAGIVTAQTTSSGPNRVTAAGVPEPVDVTISVYDVAGRLVRNLYNDRVFVSVVNQAWDGTDQKGLPVPSGMYFLKAKAGSTVGTKKVLVIR